MCVLPHFVCILSADVLRQMAKRRRKEPSLTGCHRNCNVEQESSLMLRDGSKVGQQETLIKYFVLTVKNMNWHSFNYFTATTRHNKWLIGISFQMYLPTTAFATKTGQISYYDQ